MSEFRITFCPAWLTRKIHKLIPKIQIPDPTQKRRVATVKLYAIPRLLAHCGLNPLSIDYEFGRFFISDDGVNFQEFFTLAMQRDVLPPEVKKRLRTCCRLMGLELAFACKGGMICLEFTEQRPRPKKQAAFGDECDSRP